MSKDNEKPTPEQIKNCDGAVIGTDGRNGICVLSRCGGGCGATDKWREDCCPKTWNTRAGEDENEQR